MPTAGNPRSFQLDVPEQALDDLRRRLRATRWSEAQGASDWTHGASVPQLRRLCEHWAERYDWRLHEARLNSLPQFVVEVDGLDLHFFHVRAAGGGMPLILLHGWPGSQAEFMEMVEPLSAPSAKSEAPAFDLVIPALPGFGFGGKPAEPGWGPDRIAAAFSTLMTQVLGYSRFAVHGGDWGTIIGRRMAQNHAEALIALHINMPFAYPPEGAVLPSDRQAFHARETAYLAMQATKPDALTLAQADSPAGLAAWIMDKFAAWSDCNGDPAAAIDMDALITNLMFYWLPNSASSAARIYYEAGREQQLPFGGPFVHVPTGVAAFAAEPYRAPRDWVERIYNVEHWTDFTSGGHFAAMERPAELVRDIRTFLRGRG